MLFVVGGLNYSSGILSSGKQGQAWTDLLPGPESRHHTQAAIAQKMSSGIKLASPCRPASSPRLKAPCDWLGISSHGARNENWLSDNLPAQKDGQRSSTTGHRKRSGGCCAGGNPPKHNTAPPRAQTPRENRQRSCALLQTVASPMPSTGTPAPR